MKLEDELPKVFLPNNTKYILNEYFAFILILISSANNRQFWKTNKIYALVRKKAVYFVDFCDYPPQNLIGHVPNRTVFDF